LSRKTARHSGYQQYSIAGAPQTFKVPESVSYEAASTIPLAYATAVGGIFVDLSVPIPSSIPAPINSHPPILVWGGSSSVGAFGIQLAKLSGYKVITTSSPSNFEYVKSLGADWAIDYHDPEKAFEKIKEYSGGKLSLVFDATSTQGSTAIAARALGPDGGVISVTLAVGDDAKAGRNDVDIRSSGARQVFEAARGPEWPLKVFGFVTSGLEQGLFEPNRVEVIPGGLLGVDKGWDRERKHQISGVKLVYRIADTPGL